MRSLLAAAAAGSKRRRSGPSLITPASCGGARVNRRQPALPPTQLRHLTHHCQIESRLSYEPGRITFTIPAEYWSYVLAHSVHQSAADCPNRNHGRRQDHHCLVLRTCRIGNHRACPANIAHLDPRHRLHPCHPLLRPLPQLPHPPRRCNLRPCACAQLDMQQSPVER